MFCAPTSRAMTRTMKINVRKKPLRSPPKIKHAAGDHDADDRQREGHRAGDGVAQVGQPGFIRQRTAGAFGGECVLGSQQEERQEQQPGPGRTSSRWLRRKAAGRVACIGHNSLEGYMS